MLVKCISIFSKSLPDSLRVMGENDQTSFTPLKEGNIYNVYGLMFYATRVDLLLCSNEFKPIWVPSDLFEILEHKLPQEWGCIITRYEDGYKNLNDMFGITSIIGYSMLIESYDHYVGLIERDFLELERFYRINKV